MLGVDDVGRRRRRGVVAFFSESKHVDANSQRVLASKQEKFLECQQVVDALFGPCAKFPSRKRKSGCVVAVFVREVWNFGRRRYKQDGGLVRRKG